MRDSRSVRIKQLLFVLPLCLLPNIAAGQGFYPHTTNRNIRLDYTPQFTALKAGFEMLIQGVEFDKVLAQWETALRLSPSGAFAAQLTDYTQTLREQRTRHSEQPPLSAEAIAALPEKQRIEYWVGLLPDVASERFHTPSGTCDTTFTPTCQALIKIGRPAVPSLIGCLNDRRLTRSVTFWGVYQPVGDVLRVQDAAMQCIESILDLHFFHAESSYDFLSIRAQARRTQLEAEISAWWERNHDKTPLVGYLDRLATLVSNHATIYDRVEILEKIESIDKRAADSVTRLKGWQSQVTNGLKERPDYSADASGNDQQALVYYAKQLTMRGDTSQLPAMRAILTNTDDPRSVPDGAIWCLMKSGSTSDYQAIRRRIKYEIAMIGNNGGNLEIATAVEDAIEGEWEPAIGDTRAIPLLIDVLALRQRSDTLGRADDAMRALIRLTHHDEGYGSEAAVPRRVAAMGRWIAWWRATHEM